jgi:hypothetical protein
MKPDDTPFLKSIADLAPLDRAAAISHYAYVTTAHRVGWPLRVPVEWSELDQKTRDYNIEAVRTWVEDANLLDSWLHAILEARIATVPK